MSIEFHCFACGQRLRVADEHRGLRARCPSCAAVLDIPQTETTRTPIVLSRSGPTADVIDYEIHGNEMQYVEISLDPGEMVVAEAGTLMYMTAGIEMETVLGDPAAKQPGFLARLTLTGKRLLTGKPLCLTAFFNAAEQREIVAFAAPCPGKLVPMHLDQLGGELICQKDSMLCAARGIEISIAFQKRVLAGLLGDEGFILQRLAGDGIAIVHAGGTLRRRTLEPGEAWHIDTGCLVAFTATIHYNIRSVSGVRNALSGEGLLLATLTGPGDVWLQSLPISRLAGRVLAGAPPRTDGT